MTLLADVVTASRRVTETSLRSEKVGIVAQLLGGLEESEVGIVAGFLSGVPRQGRVGVGYATVYGVESPPADESSVTVAEVDLLVTGIQAATGAGSAARRRQLLGELYARATAPEADFVRRLFTDDLRQGALAGLMLDAVARAARVPAED